MYASYAFEKERKELWVYVLIQKMEEVNFMKARSSTNHR